MFALDVASVYVHQIICLRPAVTHTEINRHYSPRIVPAYNSGVPTHNLAAGLSWRINQNKSHRARPLIAESIEFEFHMGSALIRRARTGIINALTLVLR